MTSRLFAGGPATIVLSSSKPKNFPHSPSPASIICPLTVLSAWFPDCVLSWTFPPFRKTLRSKCPPSTVPSCHSPRASSGPA